MKKSIIISVIVLVVIVAAVWLVSEKNFFRKEAVAPIKVGVLFKGKNFKRVADSFMGSFSEGLPKDRTVEYIIKDEPGIDQKDFDASAQALIDNKVDLILAVGFEPITAAKKATAVNKIPVILELGVNPATQGFVADFQRPGGNITGISWQVEELTGKRLEFLRMLAPKIKRITIFRRKGTKIMDLPLQYLSPIVEKMGITITVRGFAELPDLQKEVLATTAANTDAIFYASDPFVQRNAGLLIEQALKEKMPLMFHDDFLTKDGALASYGSSFPEAGKQGARLALKILIDKQSPADIPIETVAKVDFAINLATAKAIGLTIPDDVLSLAQLVIKE